jgi:hypothetical protein
MSNAAFDLKIAKKLASKEKDAKRRGIEFALTFQSMKNLMKAKRCYYTGIILTEPAGLNDDQIGGRLMSDRTIDRIDCNKGYVPGNVVACCNGANNLKAQFEGLGIVGLKAGRSIFDKSIKRIQGAKK